MLRRNMTPEEKHLWYDFLKKLPVPVHRQKIIGQYIVDFYIPSGKTVIEIDGSQHGTPTGREQDIARDRWLEEQGYTVIRYTNSQIHQQFREICANLSHRLGLDE